MKARSAAAALLVAGVSCGLLARAHESVAPVSASLSLARKFWSAGARTRLLNTPFFARHRGVAEAALRLDAELPLDADVRLVAAAGRGAESVEDERRVAAYLLAPRRVVVETRPGAAATSLEPAEARR